MVKLLILVFYITFSFVLNNPVYLAALLFNLILFAGLAKSLKKVGHFIILVVYLGFFIIIFNIIINNNGSTIIAILPISIPLFGHIYITAEAFIYSSISIFQLVIMIFAFSLVNLIINPDELMKTFLKLKMPYIMTFLFTMSLRFFPLLLRDLNQITNVQKSRGYELDKGNIFKRIKNRIVLILPLLSNSLERSIAVSEALESRAFGLKKKRSYYNHLSISKLDVLIISILLTNFCVLFYVM